MKIAIVLMLSLIVVGCTSLEVRQRSTPELRQRYTYVQHELASYRPEENDKTRLQRLRHLTEEQTNIEHELFRRCRAGDPGACLPYFHLIAADI